MKRKGIACTTGVAPEGMGEGRRENVDDMGQSNTNSRKWAPLAHRAKAGFIKNSSSPIRAHLMGHLPYTRFPDFDNRDPVLFCSQVQVNKITGFTYRECSAGDNMAQRVFSTGCLLTLGLCKHCVNILDLSTNGGAVIDGGSGQGHLRGSSVTC